MQQLLHLYIYLTKTGLLIYTGRIGNHEETKQQIRVRISCKYKKLISKKDVKFNRTHSFGKAIRFKEGFRKCRKSQKKICRRDSKSYIMQMKKK